MIACDIRIFERPHEYEAYLKAKVAVFRAIVPLGAPVDNLPTPKNFVDELVFKQLKTVGMPPSDRGALRVWGGT